MKSIHKTPIEEGDSDRDFAVSSLGLEYTKPGKTIGPCVRGKYIIHYVFDGTGTFNDVPIKRGSCFLICPNLLHKYHSDTKHPLKYGWISFFGHKTEAFLREVGLELGNYVFDCPWVESVEALFPELCKDRTNAIDIERYLEGCFHILMAFHKRDYQNSLAGARKKSLVKEHVENAVRYIHDHYCRRLSVEEVATACFVSTHYLSNIFKQEMGISPQKYILDVRMKRAVELLALDYLSITDIANSVGYPDVLAFSKAFHKAFGVSPRAYRQTVSSDIMP